MQNQEQFEWEPIEELLKKDFEYKPDVIMAISVLQKYCVPRSAYNNLKIIDEDLHQQLQCADEKLGKVRKWNDDVIASHERAGLGHSLQDGLREILNN